MGGGRRRFLLRFLCLSGNGNVSQAFKCYPSMPGPNLGASQIGLVLVDVPFVSLWAVWPEKGIEIQNERWTDK